MKKHFILSIIILSTLNLLGQPAIQWQKTIGGTGSDYLFTIHSTKDGGYIAGGTSNSDSSGNKTENSKGGMDYWIIKLDSVGNIQWQRTFGGNGDDWLFRLIQTSDGGFIAGGRSDSDSSGDKTENSRGFNDYWVIKLDSLGTIQWQKTLGGNDEDELHSIGQTLDKGYILGGSSASNISGDKTGNSKGLSDYWIIKVDSIGNILWQKDYGGNDIDALYSISQTTDKGYILGGLSYSDTSGDKTEGSFGGGDYWILKTDSLGTIQWQKTIGGNNADYFSEIHQTSDQGFILGGSSASDISGLKTENSRGLADYWILKTDYFGNIQWQKTIGGDKIDDLWSLQETKRHDFILGGTSSSNVSGDKTGNSKGYEDYWLVKVDSSGNIKWQKDIGGNGDDELRSIQECSDQGFILGGLSLSGISGDKTEDQIGASDYWILKIATDTYVPGYEPVLDFIVYPNPCYDYLKLRVINEYKCTLQIYNIFWELLIKLTIEGNNSFIDMRTLPAGVYIISVEDSQKNALLKKIIKL